jgi:arsenical pump membrane protein
MADLALARDSMAGRLLLTATLAGVSAAVAPTPGAALVAAVTVGTLGIVFLVPSIGRIPGHVVGPVLGALAILALPGATELLGVGVGTIGTEILEHGHVPVLILALAYLSISLDESGIFDWCSLHMMRAGRGDGRRLLVAVYLSVSVLTLFTSNDIVILSMTPILLHLARNARIRNLTPFLMAQFVAANTASMGLYVGNPTNIVIGAAAGVGFLEYSQRMFVPACIATATSLLVVWLLFTRLSRRNRVPATYVVPEEEAAAMRWTRAMSVKAALFGACLLALGVLGNPWTVAALMGSSEPDAIRRGVATLIAGVSVLFAFVAVGYDALRDLRGDSSRARSAFTGRLRRLPIEIVPFFLGFCVLLRGIEAAGLSRLAADRVEDAFRSGPILGSVATGLYGVVTVNVLNNIPSTLLFERVWLGDASSSGLETRLDALHPAAADIFVDASLFASNFGANLTFVGALAGLMWLRILRDATRADETAPRVPSTKDFVLYGLVVVPLVTVVTCVGIALLRTGLG